MSLKEKYDLTDLKNDAEELVYSELEKILDEKGEEICQCDDCVLDMICLSLNHVKPRYRVSLMGSLYTRVEDPETREQVDKAVRKAVEIVGTNPSHD
jgi:competence protein ComFB